jgi:hypothetical protein
VLDLAGVRALGCFHCEEDIKNPLFLAAPGLISGRGSNSLPVVLVPACCHWPRCLTPSLVPRTTGSSRLPWAARGAGRGSAAGAWWRPPRGAGRAPAVGGLAAEGSAISPSPSRRASPWPPRGPRRGHQDQGGPAAAAGPAWRTSSTACSACSARSASPGSPRGRPWDSRTRHHHAGWPPRHPRTFGDSPRSSGASLAGSPTMAPPPLHRCTRCRARRASTRTP